MYVFETWMVINISVTVEQSYLFQFTNKKHEAHMCQCICPCLMFTFIRSISHLLNIKYILKYQMITT